MKHGINTDFTNDCVNPCLFRVPSVAEFFTPTLVLFAREIRDYFRSFAAHLLPGP